MDPPAGMVTESLREPVPVALKPVAPPVWLAVQVSEATPGFEARGSETVAPVAVERPQFEATKAQVVAYPGTAVPTAPVIEDPPSLSVLVTDRVAGGLSVSVSVAVTVE